MKIALVVLGVLILAGLLFGGKLMGTRNDLVQQRESINGAWSQVDVDLQRRADLIPNLVNTVKGFAAQEKEILNNLANARAGMLNARTPQEKINANSQLDSALGRHPDATRTFDLPEECRFIARGVSHLGLLCDPVVYDRIRGWLSADDR